MGRVVWLLQRSLQTGKNKPRSVERGGILGLGGQHPAGVGSAGRTARPREGRSGLGAEIGFVESADLGHHRTLLHPINRMLGGAAKELDHV